MNEVEKNKVNVNYNEVVQKILRKENHYEIHTKNSIYEFETVVFAPGSSVKSMEIIKNLGHTIIRPVPLYLLQHQRQKT